MTPEAGSVTAGPVASRLEGKAAVVVGGGQTPGSSIGNGRATAVLFGRHGARVLVVDRDLGAAEDTCRQISEECGEARPHRADITVEADAESISVAAMDAFGQIDILHNNVGIGAGDGAPDGIDEHGWDRILDVNLKGMVLTTKHVLPVMRRQNSGVIVNISSAAAVASVPLTAYKASKAAVNAYTQTLAVTYAPDGIRANAIMPGLIDTPMAVDSWAEALGVEADQVRAARDRMVPLRGGQGSAWDVANAALFLASDEARFITGVVLAVDGGQAARVGI